VACLKNYAKRLASRKHLTDKESAWLDRRTAPDFDLVAHRTRMLDRDAYHHTHKRNGAMRLCIDCGQWDPDEPSVDCQHPTVLKFNDTYAAKSMTGLANRIVESLFSLELARKTIRELALDYCAQGKTDYEEQSDYG
jgi:hypothetical protein